MKIALLGDIHANASALAAVLDAAYKYGVRKLLITGDLVGYYFEPAEVLNLLKDWDKVIVRGNHEDMLKKARNNSTVLKDIEHKYGSGIKVALETLDDDQLDILCNLPHPLNLEIDGLHVLLCHGAPWNNDFYIYPDSNHTILERCAIDEFNIVVMGHTHYPMLRKIGKTQLINPGSVGQQRSGKLGAHWALLDTNAAKISLHCEPYNSLLLQAEAKQRHPELPYLFEVLTRQ